MKTRVHMKDILSREGGLVKANLSLEMEASMKASGETTRKMVVES